MAVITTTPTSKSKETCARKTSLSSSSLTDNEEVESEMRDSNNGNTSRSNSNNKRLKVSPPPPPPPPQPPLLSSSCGGGGGFSSALSVLLSKKSMSTHSNGSSDDGNVNDTESGSDNDCNSATMTSHYKYTGAGGRGFQSANSFMLNNVNEEKDEDEDEDEEKQKQNIYSSDSYYRVKQQANNNSKNNNNSTTDRSSSTCSNTEQEWEQEPHDAAKNDDTSNGIISINIKINGIKYYIDCNDRNDIIRDIYFSQSSSAASSSSLINSSANDSSTSGGNTTTTSTSTGSATTKGGRQRREIIFVREPNNEHDPNAIQAVMVVSATTNDDTVVVHEEQGPRVRQEREQEREQGRGVKIGYVQANPQSTILAPLMDQGSIEFLQIHVIHLLKTTIHLRVTLKINQFDPMSKSVTSTAAPDVLSSSSSEDSGDSSMSQQQEEAYHHRNYLLSQLTTGESFNDNRINVQQLVEKNQFAQRDLLQSYSSPYTIQDLTTRLLPWNPINNSNKNNNGKSNNSSSIISRRGLKQQHPRRRQLHQHQRVPPPRTNTKDIYSKLKYGWLDVNDASSSSTATTKIISSEEKKAVTVGNSWPPTDEILAKLGLGSADDTKWWQETAGLLPPRQWHVNGAYDLIGTGTATKTSAATSTTNATTLGRNKKIKNDKQHVASVSSKPASVLPSGPPVLLQSRQQVQRACDILDGAIHGVTNVWADQTLEAISDLMHTEHFWLNRKGESFIKVYGGSYVLGQKVEDMQLVLGATHQALTDRICCAHNLIYTVIHLENPAAPGFNTLIFGLNLSSSGFHYHQDSIPNLKGKNATLLPKQPVVTTVLYENIQEDSGKECVFWKPILNFTPRANDKINNNVSSKNKMLQSSSSTDSNTISKRNEDLYLAARACPTKHGQVHIQRAGLQKDTLHGIFHTPLCKDEEGTESRTGHGGPRTGYRVAITARICHSNSKERLVPYLGLYTGVLGPEGNLTLPRRRCAIVE